MKTESKNCLQCQNIFHVELREIKRGNGKFCCRTCARKWNAAQRPKPQPNVSCALCQTKFYLNDSKKNNSRSGLYFCCRAHKDSAQRLGGITDIMPAHYGTGEGKHDYREKALANKPMQCERCGYNAHKAAIVVHHRDRNRSNNELSNLEVLCANCHAIEHHGEKVV
jgi:hypothetical protein